MKRLHRLSMLTVLAALASTSFAAAAAGQASTAQGQTSAATAAPPATQGPAKVCLDAQAGDKLIAEFAERVRQTITASGAMSVAAPADTCNLQIHIPGNLLRFQTAGGVMVSTVAIVTSASGRYLSTSITACQASDLKPCAVRAVAAAKLALLMNADDGA